MKNEPAKEPQKDHFFDLIKGSAQPLPAPRSLANMKGHGFQAPGGYSAKQARSRNVGGASGRHGGKSR